MATDGEIGSVHDLYFDDEGWVVRYVVVDTGKWLPGPLVLVSPLSIQRPDWSRRMLPVSLTREQVRKSPPIDTHRPVSRQEEAAFLDYYGYPYYWTGTGLWGMAPYPAGPAPIAAEQVESPGDPTPGCFESTSPEDRHLRSMHEVAGYRLHATDGSLGHLEEFLIDDLNWAIRYVVVDTSSWWFGRTVLIPPSWIRQIDWMNREVHVDVTRQQVQDAPPYDQVAHVTRQWETDYHAHHQKEPYWITEDEARRIAAPQQQPWS